MNSKTASAAVFGPGKRVRSSRQLTKRYDEAEREHAARIEALGPQQQGVSEQVAESADAVAHLKQHVERWKILTEQSVNDYARLAEHLNERQRPYGPAPGPSGDNPMAVLTLPPGPAALLNRTRSHLAAHLGGEHHLILGGGTVLIARWSHRSTYDLDCFIEAGPYDRLHENRIAFERDLRTVGGIREANVRPGNGLILFEDDGEISISTTPGYTDNPRSADTVRGPVVALETTAEILARRSAAASSATTPSSPATSTTWCWPDASNPPHCTLGSGRCRERAHERLDDAPPTAPLAPSVMPLTFTEIDGHPVAVVDTEQDYHEAGEVLGVPFIFADDLLFAGGIHGITDPALSAVLMDYMLRLEDEEDRDRPPPSAGT